MDFKKAKIITNNSQGPEAPQPGIPQPQPEKPQPEFDCADCACQED